MELLLINFLEDNKDDRYNDVSIVDYSIDGTNCDVTFTHVNIVDFGEETEKQTINMWAIMAHVNYNLNK